MPLERQEGDEVEGLTMDDTTRRSPELRMDAVNRRWVIFSPARARRPSDFKSKTPLNPSNTQECPFCSGHEHECAPEIFRVPHNSTNNWKIRVIENLYPALSRDIEHSFLQNSHSNPISSSDAHVSSLLGFGFHDVVIETPIHSIQLLDLSHSEIGDILLAYKKRIEQLARHTSIKYIQVFKNHGASAGASMSHSHSQIVALPIVPPAVSARLGSMKEHMDNTGECSLCSIQLEDLVIEETLNFVSFVPFAACFPFEIWIVPREHSSHFHELDNQKAVDLGMLLKHVIKRMWVQLNAPPYNFMIQTSPLHIPTAELSHAHWYLQIVPQLTGLAGFEIGSGCHINPVFPQDAAKLLREMPLEEDSI